MRSWAVAAAVVVVCALNGACARSGSSDPPPLPMADFDTPKPLALQPGAVLADRAVSNSADVEDGQVTLPTGGDNDAFVAKLQVGTVFAGDRDTASPDLTTSKNPYGFLRRVVSIDRAPDHVVIHTQQAYLPELFEEGDLVWDPKSPRGSIFDGAAGGLVTNSLRPLDNGPQTSGGSGAVSPDVQLSDPMGSDVSFAPIVSLSNSRVGIDAAFTGEIQLREAFGLPYGVQRASARLDLDPVVSTDVTIGVKVSTNARYAFGGALYQKWDTPSIPIPIAGPIPMTVRLLGRVSCGISIADSFTGTVRVWLRGHAAAGFVYSGGFDIQSSSDPPTLTPGIDFLGATGKASLIGTCSVQAVIAVLAFDAAGMEGAIGPYVSLEGDVCVSDGANGLNPGFALFEQHGVAANIDGRLQVPGLGSPSVVQNIFNFVGGNAEKSKPAYLVGDSSTCAPKAPDSCADKPNGLYCSQLAPFSAYQCQAGDIVSGQQCNNGQKCVGPNGAGATTIQCQ